MKTTGVLYYIFISIYRLQTDIRRCTNYFEDILLCFLKTAQEQQLARTRSDWFNKNHRSGIKSIGNSDDDKKSNTKTRTEFLSESFKIPKRNQESIFQMLLIITVLGFEGTLWSRIW